MTLLLRLGWRGVGTKAREAPAFGNEESSAMGERRLQGCLGDTQVEHSHQLHRSGPLRGGGYLG